MPIRCYVGKPRQGKSYHVTTEVLKLLSDFQIHAQRNKGQVLRQIWTNFEFNREEINQYLNDLHRTDGLDYSKPLHMWEGGATADLMKVPLDSSGHVSGRLARLEKALAVAVSKGDYALADRVQKRLTSYRTNRWDKLEKGPFWDAVPQGSLILLDEFQFLFGQEQDNRRSWGGIDPHVEFRNYLSIHGHRQHDLWLVTQHQELVSVDMMRMCEAVVMVQNLKARKIPFLRIPMEDIHYVMSAFGLHRQVYGLSDGVVVGKKIEWQGRGDSCLMNPKVWKCYRSHTQSSGEIGGDRPTLDLGRWGSVRWFLGRHGFRLVSRVGGLVGGVVIILMLFARSPQIMAGIISKSMGSGLAGKAAPKPGDSASAAPAAAPVASVTSMPAAAQGLDIPPHLVPVLKEIAVEIDTAKAESAALREQIERLKANKRVAAVFAFGCLLADGRRVELGEIVSFDGLTEERLVAVNDRAGFVLWSSGRVDKVR